MAVDGFDDNTVFLTEYKYELFISLIRFFDGGDLNLV